MQSLHSFNGALGCARSKSSFKNVFYLNLQFFEIVTHPSTSLSHAFFLLIKFTPIISRYFFVSMSVDCDCLAFQHNCKRHSIKYERRKKVRLNIHEIYRLNDESVIASGQWRCVFTIYDFQTSYQLIFMCVFISFLCVPIYSVDSTLERRRNFCNCTRGSIF